MSQNVPKIERKENIPLILQSQYYPDSNTRLEYTKEKKRVDQYRNQISPKKYCKWNSRTP